MWASNSARVFQLDCRVHQGIVVLISPPHTVPDDFRVHRLGWACALSRIAPCIQPYNHYFHSLWFSYQWWVRELGLNLFSLLSYSSDHIEWWSDRINFAALSNLNLHFLQKYLNRQVFFMKWRFPRKECSAIQLSAVTILRPSWSEKRDSHKSWCCWTMGFGFSVSCLFFTFQELQLCVSQQIYR